MQRFFKLTFQILHIVVRNARAVVDMSKEALVVDNADEVGRAGRVQTEDLLLFVECDRHGGFSFRIRGGKQTEYLLSSYPFPSLWSNAVLRRKKESDGCAIGLKRINIAAR